MSTPPGVFKGIALFTPGGDLFYCVDPHKQTRWHLDLCATLQSHLALSEPPFFLLPCYTATVDRWIDGTGQLVTLAEAYPRVLHYQPLLNVVFGLKDVTWQPNYSVQETCSSLVLDSYRSTFPQLWDYHNLVVRSERLIREVEQEQPETDSFPVNAGEDTEGEGKGYCFRLFVKSSDQAATETTLRLLRNTFEGILRQPYSLQVIDVTKHPEQAEADLISATPTLIRVFPLPVRRLVGGMNQRSRLLSLLDLSQ